MEAYNRFTALYEQGRYGEAERFAHQALELNKEEFGPDHPTTAILLNDLAFLFDAQGRYSEAEPLCKRALAILEKALGPDHPDVATNLNNLAKLYGAQGRYAEAEPLYRRSLAIDENALGPEHPEVATGLNNLAGLYQAQGLDRHKLWHGGAPSFRFSSNPGVSPLLFTDTKSDTSPNFGARLHRTVGALV